jgi:septal ring factor EnvC (AmiA/AmiB activator)
MLTANKLEKIIELEDKLRSEYQARLDDASAELERCKSEHEAQRQQLQATIDQQLETIQELSEKSTANQQIEQRHRELSNRSEKQQDEIATQKKRIKALQKDLAKEREQLKELTQYDPQRMKKNLDASKKKLAEKTRAADLLQKSLKETRNENIELQGKIRELEEKLAALEADSAVEEEAA